MVWVSSLAVELWPGERQALSRLSPCPILKVPACSVRVRGTHTDLLDTQLCLLQKLGPGSCSLSLSLSVSLHMTTSREHFRVDAPYFS